MKNPWRTLIPQAAFFLLLLSFAAWFRFHGPDWDQGTHLHPDERFLTMVAAALRPPANLAEYFDTAHSVFNPHNVGHPFYVYGTLPLFLTRCLADRLGMADYAHIHLVGRCLSALFDLMTLFGTMLIGHFLFGLRAGLAAGAMYAVSVLAIQQAHFFTVDSFATAFFTWSLLCATRIAISSTHLLPSLVGFALCLGCAASSKINLSIAFLLLPGSLYLRFSQPSTRFEQNIAPPVRSLGQPAAEDFSEQSETRPRRLLRITGFTFCTLLLAFLVFRCTSPYLFTGPGFLGLTPNPKAIENFRALASMASPSPLFPPSFQWIDRNVAFSGWNLATWGIGFPFFLFAAVGLGTVLFSAGISPRPLHVFAFWTIGHFLLQSLAPNPTLRYQLPTLPGLAIAAGFLWTHSFPTSPLRTRPAHADFLWARFFPTDPFWTPSFPSSLGKWLGRLVFVFTFGWALAFSAVYQQPHSRVAASQWIMNNVASGTVLAFESAWDDAIPLLRGDNWGLIKPFLDGPRLEIHEPDSASKAARLVSILSRADVLVITSNRMYGSLCRLPGRYPLSTAFYRLLLGISSDADPVRAFAELADTPLATTPLKKISFQSIPPQATSSLQTMPIQANALQAISASRSFSLGFAPMAVFTSFPRIGPFTINDQSAEEAFTVYDHPQVTLFRKTPAFDAARVASLLNASLPVPSQ
ncbi:MAG: glycosyltransferase family 39 protein [Candidatus Ozemobacteraceae bacterium]